MKLICVGCDHTTAPLAVRERLSIGADSLPEALERVGEDFSEVVILSTCNRTEFYLVGGPEADLETVRRWLLGHSALSREELASYLHVSRGQAAVRHLFRVTAGLEALVVGETQIIAQVKEAYQAALAAGTSGPTLTPLFQQALRVAKRVHSETALGQAAVSVAYAAVALAKDVLGSLAGRGVLLLGAGELAELCLTHLQDAGIGQVLVANRTLANAQTMAARLGGKAVPFTQAARAAAEVDMVIGSTGAPHAVLDRQDVESMMAERDGRPLFIFDLAVPRDVAADAAQVPGVRLYHIDHLRDVVAANVSGRQDAAILAGRLVDQAVKAYLARERGRLAVPLIVALNQRADQIARRELERLWRRFPELDAKQREAIIATTTLVAKKLVDPPLRKLRSLATRADGPQALEVAAELLGLASGESSAVEPEKATGA